MKREQKTPKRKTCGANSKTKLHNHNHIMYNQLACSEPGALWGPGSLGVWGSWPLNLIGKPLLSDLKVNIATDFAWRLSEYWTHYGFSVFRQGQKCTQDELGASALLTVNLDDSMGGVATQVRHYSGLSLKY